MADSYQLNVRMNPNCMVPPYHRKRKQPPPRIVPAFTIQALQKGVQIAGPPKAYVYRARRPQKASRFRQMFDRGDLPMEVGPSNDTVIWKADIKKLDYHHYLPLAFEGLCETEEPYNIIAMCSITDMLNSGSSKVLPVVPQLILPIKNALNTKVKPIMIATMDALQKLVKSSPFVGEALVPYYRQILPILNIFKHINVNCGENIDFSHMKNENLGDKIAETLEILEMYGGEDAFINIKYMVPTYESCMMN